MSSNSVKRNARIWGNPQIWENFEDGETWSESWGSSRAQWYGTLYPRLHRYFPARRVLEIGPGYGRWTRYLVNLCEQLVGVDLSAACIQKCRERFANREQAQFIQTDGLSLEAVGREPFDLVFSFDSLVHADKTVMSAYIVQILPLLTADGVAFLHHSNLAAELPRIDTRKASLGWRAPDVSADWVAEEIHMAGGHVVSQELHSWEPGHRHLIDTMTIFSHGKPSAATTRRVENPDFIDEAARWKTLDSVYFYNSGEDR